METEETDGVKRRRLPSKKLLGLQHRQSESAPSTDGSGKTSPKVASWGDHHRRNGSAPVVYASSGSTYRSSFSPKHDSMKTSSTTASGYRDSVGSAQEDSAILPSNEEASFYGMSASWVPDSLASHCYGCRKEFGSRLLFGTAKHHCRHCGNVVCGTCSLHKLQLCANDKPVRVCNSCFDYIAADMRIKRKRKEGEQQQQQQQTNQHHQQRSYSSTDTFVENGDEERGSDPGTSDDAPDDDEEEEELNYLINNGGGGEGGLNDAVNIQDHTSLEELILGHYEDVYFEDMVGEILLTSFQIVMFNQSANFLGKIPVMTIERLELEMNDELEAGSIKIYCKNLRFVKLTIYGMVSKQRFVEFHALEHMLVNLAFPPNATPFHERFTMVSEHSVLSTLLVSSDEGPDHLFAACCGAKHYDDKADLVRMIEGCTNIWRISKANEKFTLCDSYPRYFITPISIKDEELFRVASFRSRNRIPVVSWLDPEFEVALCRSSQPKVGLLNGRSMADEKLVRAIAQASSAPLVIFDARPVVNATVNKVSSGGFEDVERYCTTKYPVTIEFGNVHNTNTVRASFHKVKKMIAYGLKRTDLSEDELNDFEISFASKFAESHWLEHEANILKAVSRCVSIIKKERKSLLVHCSDGWDRTTQIVSLSMMMMDGQYRTIEGFISLIEKEWVSLGHPFRRRTGIGQPAALGSTKETIKLSSAHLSPIFIQFMECIWHISRQFPSAFQFNQRLLLLMIDRVFDARHGNFLVNSRYEAFHNELPFRTSCFWEEVMSEKSKFLNRGYAPTQAVLYPKYSTKLLSLWKGLFLRYDETFADYSVDLARKTLESTTSRRNSRRMIYLRSSSFVSQISAGPTTTNSSSTNAGNNQLDAQNICQSILCELISDAIIQSLTNKLQTLM